MIEKIMKVVKNSNKKRSRNITTGAVIGFLLSCTVAMGADKYLYIKDNGGIIEFSTNSTTGSNGDWSSENPYEDAGNIWDKDTKTYTNNITLSSNGDNGVLSGNKISYALWLSGNMEKLRFINNSLITGIGGDYTYGIFNQSDIGNITNTGVISSHDSKNGPSNGIYNANNIGNIINTGVIGGFKSSGGGDTSIGIFNAVESIIGDTINTGLITGSGYLSGYGIENFSGAMEKITNRGIISGNSSGNGKGYGIMNDSGRLPGTMENITNRGIISGNSSGGGEGYGIMNSGSEVTIIINTGVIYGKTSAISNYHGAAIGSANNYGILVNGDDGKGVVDGLAIVDETPEKNKIVNKGLIFKAVRGTYKAEEKDYKKFGEIYEDENVIIGYQKDSSGKPDLNKPITEEYTIINAKAEGTEDSITGTKSLELENGILTYGNSSTIGISSNKRYILNGITDTLEVSGKNNELNDSVINAYKTAVVMEKNDSTFILNNTVVNGGLSGNDPTISITGNKNILTIQGNSVINGTMESTGKNNTLNFNGNGENGINILHNISGFSNMNIDNNVTFFEDVKVTGTEKIIIAETGTLNLRLKNTGNEENVDGKPIPKATHAFSGNTGMIIQGEGNGVDTAGTLNFITNGIGKKIYVDMKDIELRNLYFKTSSVIDGYDVKDKEYIILGAHGSLNGIYKPENTGKDSHRYEALNNIYKGIYSSTDDNLNALRVLISSNEKLGNNYDENLNDEEQLKNLLSYLGSIYTETPYSFSSELSRKSAGMFRDIVTENQFRPDLNRWLIMGGLTHRDGGTKDSYYGQNYHGFDTGTADVDVDMKLTGAYALGKYGYSENISLGITAGGNKSEAKLSMSKVKGNSGYIGAFAENYRGNLTLKGGAGIQYSEYDANRATIGGHSYSDKYSDMTYDIYLNGRYSHNIGNNLFLEPYGTLSYTYIKQDNADEGSKVLAIETDSKSFDYTAAKVGVDIKKVIPHEKGKSTLSAGVSYTRLLNGADEENITGRFKGGSDFDILVAHKNEHSIGLNAKYALELENGVLFDVKGSYNVERDSHNGSGKNRTKGEWIVGVGIGYKF
ncbi:autotransporter family protein [Fusobacterium varium]|uniref:autotransporter family protein n=2 Tax=Fusobacterium varium TaxID=856 RepID=UPI000E42B5C3|nr:autotransporter outer membrane beta-barrel domain-containing protein [Fusobacterium varium]RGJ30194.1 autotransporter outer membrane beta-barrel domain-containing protein [Fusobacterium varium]